MSHKRRRKNGKNEVRPVKIGGREYPVIGRMTIRRHTYLLLKQLGGPGRTRYMAFDPDARGELRSILVLPNTPAAERHARVLKRLPPGNHNLPRLLNYDKRDDQLRLVLTWVNGRDLKSYLEQVKAGRVARPSAYECLRLIRGLAHGLRSFHIDAQLIHGDLKPANLILTRKRSYLATIDFGSAWLVEQAAFRITDDGVSPVYAAPELQANGLPLNFCCDRFSASVIFYELLTLQVPYANLGGKAGRPEYVEQTQRSLIPPSQLSPDRDSMPQSIWQGIDRLVTTGLALDPHNRYASTGSWLDDLDGVFAEIKYLTRPRTPQPSVLTRVTDWLSACFQGQGNENHQ